MHKRPDWITRGKTVRQLIQELQTFEDQNLEVRMSVDGGDTDVCISLVGKGKGKAVLINCEREAVIGPNQ